MNKFNTLYNKLQKYYLNTGNNNPIADNRHYKKIINESFSNMVYKLLLEDYHIFPVPKLLLDDMEQFILTNNSLSKKLYTLIDIQTKYCTNWQYYMQFNRNIELMLKENIQSSITLVAFNEFDIDNILKLYKDQKLTLNMLQDNFAILSCEDQFNCYLFVKQSSITGIRKAIQHELIHWQQVSLNSETESNYGLFNNKIFNLTNEQIKWLAKYIKDIKQTYNYLLNGREFEAWVANTCEEFEKSKLTIKQFKNIIENKLEFEININKAINSYNIGKEEMLIFSEICYLNSLNNNKDDRYWYLIEALKENKL